MGSIHFTYHFFFLNEIWLYSISNQIYLVTLLLVFSLAAYLFLKNREPKPFELSSIEQFYYLNALIHKSKTASLIVDNRNKIRLANHEFLQLFDLTTEQLDQKFLSEIPLYDKLVQFISSTDQGEHAFELPNGKEPVNVQASSIITNDGQELGRLIQIQSNNLLSETLQHDIKTPMNAIVGYSHLLEDEHELTDKQKKYLSIIQKQAFLLRDKISPALPDRDMEGPETPSDTMWSESVKHILIADDVSINRTFLRIMLDRKGYTITEAEDGEQAVQKFFETSPDLILMDISMPVMNGIEAARKIRNSNHKKRRIPIIAVTANYNFSEKNSLRENGFNAFLQKPFKEDELVNILDAYSIRLPKVL